MKFARFVVVISGFVCTHISDALVTFGEGSSARADRRVELSPVGPLSA